MDDFDAALLLESLGCVTYSRPLTAREESELNRYLLAQPEDVASDAAKLNVAIRDWARRHGLLSETG